VHYVLLFDIRARLARIHLSAHQAKRFMATTPYLLALGPLTGDEPGIQGEFRGDRINRYLRDRNCASPCKGTAIMTTFTFVVVVAAMFVAAMLSPANRSLSRIRRTRETIEKSHLHRRFSRRCAPAHISWRRAVQKNTSAAPNLIARHGDYRMRG
jgi:hypothetical protein